MKARSTRVLVLVLVWGFTSTLSTLAAPAEGGQVELPLALYEGLIAARESDTSYVLGTAQVSVDVPSGTSHPTGQVNVQLAVELLDGGRAMVPLLPAGTVLSGATVDGRAVQLVPLPAGLSWNGTGTGTHKLVLDYRIEAHASSEGFTLSVPLPRAAAVHLNATLPEEGLDVAVLPATTSSSATSGSRTRINAIVPPGPGVQISWRTPARRSQVIGRASYVGTLSGDSVSFTAELGIDGFSDRPTIVPLVHRSVTLSDLRLDGKPAPILVEGDRFATLIGGRGAHTVVLGFEVPVQSGDGPPRIDLDLPPIPISRFELTLPGDKELAVTPAAAVQVERGSQRTVATVFLPMAPRASFTWSEAVPLDAQHELRATAAIHHAVHAAENVLYVRAMIDYQVSRGTTHLIELELPPNVQVSDVECASGAIVEWRVEPATFDGEPPLLSLFLDRELEGGLSFVVGYDRSLEGVPLDVPLLRALGTQRQRGMVALLADPNLTLRPLPGSNAVEVGEDQLPVPVRQSLERAVAHTFKYLDESPRIVVEAAPPERLPGRFDVQVDTLLSLADATLMGSSSLAVQVKSGRVFDLHFTLPEEVELLDLSAPSLRSRTIDVNGAEQTVKLEFTQGMEGQFKIELAYERILTESEQHVAVPALEVRGADVQQGRIAVEALSAVEVRAGEAEGLSPLDVRELPRQLVLKTTNPVLLAYKYAQIDPPPRLDLALTRHLLLDVQEAVIDEALYRTLVTADGLQVTSCRFMVRNSRQQFLRVGLPPGAEVWSATVDGKPDKPALGGVPPGGSAGPQVLLRIINQSEGFPVELTYATTSGTLGRSGKLNAALPRPDVLVSRSRWDLYLPESLRYGTPSTNMQSVTDGANTIDEGAAAAVVEAPRAWTGAEPPRIVVPADGVHLAFEKLYANRSTEDAWFRIDYRRK